MVLCAFSFFVLVMGLYTYSIAGSEKGAKKCSDTIDNDGDGLIDANDPDCGGDSGGIGVLKDASGITIGKVVGISGGSPIVEILFDVSDQTFSAKIIGEIQINTVTGFQRRKSVLFDNVNCTGAAWISPADTAETAFFDEFRVAIIVGDSPEERRLYAPTSEVSQFRTVNSTLEEVCSNITDVREVVPVILLDGDLHTTFPKPYSLVLN